MQGRTTASISPTDILLARRLPVWTTAGIAVAFELLTLWTIRDNLTLNMLMLVAPVDAFRTWQGD